jgi:O-antigen/teichoic acid export membrane protein
MGDPAAMGEPPYASGSGLDSTTARLMVSAGRVAGANGVTSLLMAAIAVITARVLGPNGRGVIVLIATAATYVMLVSSLGVTISGRVMLGRGDRRATIAQYLGLGLSLSIVQIALTMILIRLLLIGSGVQVAAGNDVIMGLYGGGYMAAYLLVQVLYGLGLNDYAASVQIAGALMQLVPVAVLGSAGIASPWPYVGAMLGGTLGQVAVSLVILGYRDFLVWPSFSAAGWLALVAKGIPAIGLTFGQAATLRIDRILIGLFLTASPVGIYSVAATGTEVVWLIPTALSQVLFQKFASKSVDLRSATRARVVSLAFGLATAVVIFAIAPPAIDLLVGAKFAGAVVPLRILLVAALLLSSYQLDAFSLAAHGRIGLAASATLVGFAVVLVADLLLIPAYGIIGAAWASVLAYGSMAAVVRIMVKRLESRVSLAGPPATS